MTKISTLKKENENILPRTKIEGVAGLKEELEKISKYNETAIEQVLRLVEQVSANKEAIEGQDTKIANLENNNTNLEESNGTLSNQVETLQLNKQNKLVAGENTTLTDNEDGTTTISSINSGGTISNKVNIARELLWENPNPNQDFTAQDITLSNPYTDYDIIGVYFDALRTYSFYAYAEVPTSQCIKDESKSFIAGTTALMSRIYKFKSTNTDNVMTWDVGQYNGGNRNSSMIPLRIYGIKFIDTTNYSTEEHWTGKRWIDGKKIYEKTFDCGSATSNKDLTVNVSNAEYITSIAGIAKTTSNTFIALGYNNSGNVQHCYNLYVADITETTLRLSINLGSGVPTSSMYITIQYTKTTE